MDHATVLQNALDLILSVRTRTTHPILWQLLIQQEDSLRDLIQFLNTLKSDQDCPLPH